MRLLRGHDETVAAFVADLAPVERPVWRDPYWAFGVIRDDGALVGGVVFSDLRQHFGTVELSGAAISRLAFGPQILAELGEFAFGKLGAFRVWARTSVRNKPAQALLKHIGFTAESVQAHWYGEGHHAACLRVIKPDWERRTKALQASRQTKCQANQLQNGLTGYRNLKSPVVAAFGTARRAAEVMGA